MLIIIPARKGSKGIPGKNVRPFRGYPLVAYSFAAGQVLARALGGRVVCTTDDPKVMQIASAMDVGVHKRKADLANDTAGMAGVVIDACQAKGAADYVLLQPTSPLRILNDIKALAVKTLTAGTVVSCTHPVEAPEDLVELGRGPVLQSAKTETRQDRTGQYRFVDGAYYAGKVAALTAGLGFMPKGTEFVTLSNPMATDIDTPFDWALAEAQHDWLVDEGIAFVRPD